jgi:DNA repair protein RecO (recombination protein O)
MPARVSEAFVLRTYPFQEGDLIVSFFTRDQGKLRGVAKRARRPKSSFGSGLERLSQVKITFHQRENAELVRMEGCELLQSQFGVLGSYEAGVALDYIAEVSDQLLPPAEPNERFYRLIAAVLAHLRKDPETGLWRAATYFTYWAVKLSGILPELSVSGESRELARNMAVTPVDELPGASWSKETGRDLRHMLQREMEYHIERRLVTAAMLEAL